MPKTVSRPRGAAPLEPLVRALMEDADSGLLVLDPHQQPFAFRPHAMSRAHGMAEWQPVTAVRNQGHDASDKPLHENWQEPGQLSSLIRRHRTYRVARLPEAFQWLPSRTNLAIEPL